MSRWGLGSRSPYVFRIKGDGEIKRVILCKYGGNAFGGSALRLLAGFGGRWPRRVTEIVFGKRGITADAAVRSVACWPTRSFGGGERSEGRRVGQECGST